MTAVARQQEGEAPARTKGGQFKRRISAKTKKAISYMVGEGLSRPKAAEKAGMSYDALRMALAQPHVKAFYRREVEESFSIAGLDALRTAQELMQDADSEHVRMKAAEWIAGVHGVAPVNKHQHQHQHSGEVGFAGIGLAAHPRLKGSDVQDAEEIGTDDS